ncbi:arylsulfatase [Reichenbachiella sp. MALMAid0571]|uniref:sulfatase family protein n=1 Tax=Reichenbachiella sp. MALMAid0571 TaxID=3143939 RepID=UPI0032DE812F
MKKITLLMLLAIFLFSACTKEKNPNIVIILADDLGYGDPQVYNSESKITTPNIDQLAVEGMRFTDAHTPSSVCTPTRYGLLTGRYAWRTELKKSVLWMWDKPLIAKNRLTIPKMLKAKNYTTACIGKWHLGWRWPSNQGSGFMNDTIPIGDYRLKGRNELWERIDFSKELGGGPLEAGFDYYFGDDVPNFAPYTFFENNKLTKIPNQIKPNDMYGGSGPMSEDWKLENVMPEITKRAVKYIEEKTQSDKPFFLYFALTAPHTPIAPTDEFKGKSEAGLYGDFVHEVDWSVGQVVKALKKSGEFENTLIIFTSDNGSPQRDGTNMGGQIASVKKYGHDPSRPWKGMKADIWEGGHRVPFIASWPGKIEANTVNDQLVCLTDIISSVASILKIPKKNDSMEDSWDISPTLFQNNTPIREDLIHHSIDGTFAIRKGDWKLIEGRNSGGFSKGLKIDGIPVETEGQLYNIYNDPSEKDNLYASDEIKVRELSQILNKYKTTERSSYE